MPDKGMVEDLTKEFLAESQEGLERMELCLTELERRPGDGELLSEIFRTVHTIKGTTSFLGFSRLQTLAHTGEGLLAALRDGKIAVTPELITGLLNLLDGLRKVLRLIETTGTEGERSSDDDGELIALLVELNSGRGRLAPVKPPVPGTRDAGPADPPGDQTNKDRTLRIDVEVLNRMMNLVGELVLTRNQILQSTPQAGNFPELARRLNNVTSELRESVRQARMQSIGHLFGKFPRMVRDLARTCEKKVRIEFEGQETRLDKSLLEAIRDPLAHAVRNSVDHGIEPPAQRLLAGKPAEGVIRLRAFHQSGSVVIEVIDDGDGISTERVLAKAIERGLVTAGQAATLTEHEVLQMIFVAGFSTAREVTSVSGRGVGMDVVRANVDKVGGSVELESRAGAGTTMRLRVPLTLAIVPALVVQSAGQSFVLPQSAVIELVYVSPRDAATAIERMGSSELYRLREELLPLVRLNRILRIEPSPAAQPGEFYIAVLESEGIRFGLIVDHLKAPEEIVVKPLSRALSEIGMFSGATVLGNASLALILDVAAICARAGLRPLAKNANPPGADPAQLRGQATAARVELERSMLIYEGGPVGMKGTGKPAQMAMPLRSVERIERIPLSRIEYAGGRALLQYGGELLPLEDDGAILPGLGAAGDAMVTVMICLLPGTPAERRVGMVVRRVLDVSSGTLLAVPEGLREGQLAMVNSRVATIHRDFAVQTSELAALQEVA
jgi:two-component system chemotaxis sensor kinase CheA